MPNQTDYSNNSGLATVFAWNKSRLLLRHVPRGNALDALVAMRKSLGHKHADPRFSVVDNKVTLDSVPGSGRSLSALDSRLGLRS